MSQLAHSRQNPAKFLVTVGEYRLVCVPDGLPLLYEHYKQQAEKVYELDLELPNRCCLAVLRPGSPWPNLLVAVGYRSAGVGFEPGVLVAPETQRLFLGAGSRLWAFSLTPPDLLWTEPAEVGFWEWARHGDVVLMSADLQLAAWDLSGKKLWSTMVEPPWTYQVREGQVHLDVMGRLTSFPLGKGPP